MSESVWDIRVMILTGKPELLGEKSASVPLCPPQIPHIPAWNSVWISVMRSR